MRLHAFLLTTATLSLPATAHELWLEQNPAGYTLHQGHQHSTHAGSEFVPYPADAVKGAVCLRSDGTVKNEAVGQATPWTTPSRCSVLLAHVSTGYWTKTPWDTVNAPRSDFGEVLKSWLSEESVKRVDAWIPAAARPLGDALEITPTRDPLALRPDDKLTVLVTEQGQPRAGVPVAYDGNTRGVSGEDGKVAIRIRHGGAQMISASVETPLNDGKGDVKITAAVLQFELPQ